MSIESGITPRKKRTPEQEKRKNEFQRIIGNRLRILREERKMSQRDVSEQLGFKTQAAYGKIEAGDVALQPENCIAIANFFGVSCDYILRGVESENVDICKRTGLTQKSVEVMSLFEAARLGYIKDRKKIVDQIDLNKNDIEKQEDLMVQAAVKKKCSEWLEVYRYILNRLLQDEDLWKSVYLSAHSAIESAFDRFRKDRDAMLKDVYDFSAIDDTRIINGCKYSINAQFTRFFEQMLDDIDFFKCIGPLPEDISERALREYYTPGWGWLDHCNDHKEQNDDAEK